MHKTKVYTIGIIIVVVTIILSCALLQRRDSLYQYSDLDLNKCKGGDIRIAIIDSGIISESLVYKKKIVERDFSSENENKHRHGTQVANIILGTGNMDLQLQSEIISYKITDKEGRASIDQLCNALVAGIEDDVDIINISLSTQRASYKLKNLIKKALRKNIIIVASYDNIAQHNSYPAQYKGVIGVKQEEVDNVVIKEGDIIMPIEKKFLTDSVHKEPVYENSFATAFVTGSVVRIIERLDNNNIEYIKKELAERF